MVHKDNPQLVGHPDCTYSGAVRCPIETAGTGSHPDSTLRDCLLAPFCTSAATFAPPGGTWNQERITGECQFVRPVYPSFHLSVLWAEVVSNPRCLSVIHTFHFSLLYSYFTQCFKRLYSQLIFTQTKIVTNEGTIASSSSAIAFCLNYY